LVTDLNAIVGASLSAEVLVHTVFALLLSLAVAKALGHMRATPAPAGADGGAAQGQRPLWLGLLLAAAGLAVAAAVLAVALGYVALAGTLARQMVWSGVVFAATYLLMQLGDDLCDALLSSKGGFGAHIHATLGLDAQLLDQAAVLVSGVLRLVLFFYMAVALMAPLGTDPDELFRRGSSLDHSLQIGDITLAPQALLTALAVVCAGFLGIRLFKHWLSERYFPHTSLEPGMRVSIVTLLGYAGAVVVVAVALAGLGISVERIAWVASALTVGIGFGLQAIVQNFISGLILLAEQPVKVGDWVVLGDTEGDVRRVNVRATEIQLGDKSTVIVPNSEFITKTVRNMTLGSAQGRVLLRLPAPLDTDARRMRELILQAFYAHQGILDSPAPSVTLEGIQSGTLTFLAIGYVSSPRQAAGVRSEVLFAILEALRAAGLTLSPPATTTVAQPQGEPAQERS
ncbi:MAG: mechanosensitive ion channel, partial [Proteobacteria bacterium]|nr:mechanosensitive ion channel [Pseudomonadota bacterium]